MHMCMSVRVVPYTCICVPSFVIIVHALGAFCKPPHSSCHEMERHGPMDLFCERTPLSACHNMERHGPLHILLARIQIGVWLGLDSTNSKIINAEKELNRKVVYGLAKRCFHISRPRPCLGRFGRAAAWLHIVFDKSVRPHLGQVDGEGVLWKFGHKASDGHVHHRPVGSLGLGERLVRLMQQMRSAFRFVLLLKTLQGKVANDYAVCSATGSKANNVSCCLYALPEAIASQITGAAS